MDLDEIIMQTLTRELQDNLGNRITPALANGVLTAVAKNIELFKALPSPAPKEPDTAS